MKEIKTLIDDSEVNYKIAGEGPAVLVLHGWGGSSDSWIEVQAGLAKQGFKVIVPDFPGFGKSHTPKTPWGLTDYMNWLNSFINFIKLEEFYLVAHSFGGRVAIRFISTYPEKVKKLVLCAAAGIKPKPGIKTVALYYMSSVGNAILSPKHLVRIKDGVRNFFYLFLRHKDYVKAQGTMKETIKLVLTEDLLLDLPKVKTGTLIIWGTDDRMIPVKYAHIFQENIEDSKIEILPKIGHSPHLEVPAKLTEIITGFLKS